MISPYNMHAKAVTDEGKMGADWIEFFSGLYDAVSALQSSGITANRPKRGLFIGRTYFDTTLNKPIWISNDGATWVDATGSPV